MKSIMKLFVVMALFLVALGCTSVQETQAEEEIGQVVSEVSADTNTTQVDSVEDESQTSANEVGEMDSHQDEDRLSQLIGQLDHITDDANAPSVFITTDICSEGLMKAYMALGKTPSGNVAVKLHTGEGEDSNYLRPDFIKDLVQSFNGTIVESNTAYGGSRASTALHKQVIEDRGFNTIAAVDIMDEDGGLEIPVVGGRHLESNQVGASFADYDYFVVLSHFKGHMMGGFGGALKNTSIGIASSEGKSLIHSGGKDHTGIGWETPVDIFTESMAEAAKSVSDYLDEGDRILYINVMNNISVDCDCVANPAEPDMHDIGILASFDPVALDQACVDLIYASPDSASVVERIESRNGVHILEHAEAIGLGSRTYQLVRVDD